MALTDDLRERIQLQWLIEGAGNVGHHYQPLDTVWASVEDQGDGRYRFRIRYRDDLRQKDDLEPAMHLVYRGVTLVVDDVSESVRHTEVTIAAHREIIEEIDHLATGTRRIKSWP